MNSTLRRTLTASVSAVLGTMLAGSAALAAGAITAPTSSAATSPRLSETAPPWEPDPDSVGGLLFFNSAGDEITGGSITDSPIAAYVEGTNTIRAGDVKATLFGYLPVEGESTGEFQGESLGESTAYPNSSAPAPLNTATLPVETGASGDEDLSELESDFPNNGTGAYAGMYQLRLRTSPPPGEGGLTIDYDSADIQITGDTWSVVYTQAPQTPTTTTLSVSPSTSARFGSNVRLTATVSPSAAAGTVKFTEGSSTIKSVAVTDGTAEYTTDKLAAGTAKLAATFVPTDSATYGGSSSATHDLKITAASTTTTLKASKSSVKEGTKVTLTAKESPSSAAGSVEFYDGSKKLGSATVKGGVATYSTTKLPVGTDSLKAVFTAKDKADYGSSTSKTVKVKVTK